MESFYKTAIDFFFLSWTGSHSRLMIVNVLSVGASLVSLSLLHLLSFYASGLKSEVAILINLHVRLPLTSGRPHLKPHSLPLNQARETGDKGGGGTDKSPAK